MQNINGKKAGAKLTLILLSTFIFLLLFASPASAVTLGDVTENNAINVQDVVLVMQHILGTADPALTASQRAAADVNSDNAINVQDANLIMQYVLGLIDEFPGEAPVADVEVVSVKAIDRETIEVELVENVDEDLAADEDEYEVTVDGDEVEVEEVDYDADDDIAILTVDMDGMSGVLKVNGVEADEEVPAIPELTSISSTEGSRDITLKFNTPVYEYLSLRYGLDFELTVAGVTRSIVDIEIPDDADDAEDEFVITVETAGRPEAFDAIVVTIKASGAERIRNVWDEPMEELAVRSTTAQKDDTSPTFEKITVYEDSTFVVAHFSEPVSTSGNHIRLGSLSTQVQVTGKKVDNTPLEYDDPGLSYGIVAIGQDDEQNMLRIELDDTVPKGAEITVRFGATAGSWIEDRAGNSLAGTYTRSATTLAGPTLKDVSVSDIGAGSDEQTQTFNFTLVGEMVKDEKVVIDLDDATARGITYSSLNSRYEAEGADGSVTSDGSEITFKANVTIPDGTSITIKAEDVDTIGVGAEEEIEVVFERSEVGATVTAEFDVLSGLAAISIEAFYQRQNHATNENITTPVEVLGSGQEDHTVVFEFTLTDQLEDGNRVEIGLSNLVAAGASFSGDDLDVNVSGIFNDADVEMSGNNIIVTADGNISVNAVVTVTAEEVDVDEGSAAEDILVYFSRSDSGITFAAEVDIVPGFTDFEVSPIASATDEVIILEFRLDGERETFGHMGRIELNPLGLPFDFTDAEADSPNFASLSVNETTGVVTFSAPIGGISDGTLVAIEVSGVDASAIAADKALIVLERRPGGFQRAGIMDID